MDGAMKRKARKEEKKQGKDAGEQSAGTERGSVPIGRLYGLQDATSIAISVVRLVYHMFIYMSKPTGSFTYVLLHRSHLGMA